MILNIAKDDEPILHKKAQKVTVFDQDLRLLVGNMIDTIRYSDALGLAAPQVYESKQVIVVKQSTTVSELYYVLVNPEIVFKSQQKLLGVESCLSLPEKLYLVSRHEKITVKAKSEFGQHVVLRVSDMLARVIQHEIDHLHGILLPDSGRRLENDQVCSVNNEVNK